MKTLTLTASGASQLFGSARLFRVPGLRYPRPHLEAVCVDCSGIPEPDRYSSIANFHDETRPHAGPAAVAHSLELANRALKPGMDAKFASGSFMQVRERERFGLSFSGPHETLGLRRGVGVPMPFAEGELELRERLHQRVGKSSTLFGHPTIFFALPIVLLSLARLLGYLDGSFTIAECQERERGRCADRNDREGHHPPVRIEDGREDPIGKFPQAHEGTLMLKSLLPQLRPSSVPTRSELHMQAESSWSGSFKWHLEQVPSRPPRGRSCRGRRC